MFGKFVTYKGITVFCFGIPSYTEKEWLERWRSEVLLIISNLEQEIK